MEDFGLRWREEILPRVQKPARYVGGEWNSVRKDAGTVSSRVALAFPDVYEIGISYQGFQILYEILNRAPDIFAERVYSPWVDCEQLLREKQLPLVSVETSTPLYAFDWVGITLQHEMSYSNVLNLLDLGGIPLAGKDRGEEHPLIAGGGPCAANPEPLADLFDLILLGDGEAAFLEMIRLNQALRGRPRAERIRRLSEISGVYAPSRYTPGYTREGILFEVAPEPGAPYPVQRRVESPPDLPLHPLVPNVGATHDRISVELFRGCTQGCRFCQAGMINRPVRERDPEAVMAQLRQSLQSTGYEEVSLSSLSSSDYSQLFPLVSRLAPELSRNSVALSFPSLRLDSFQGELAEWVARVRKTGLTFAPEAGSPRLRRVINKVLEESAYVEDLGGVFSQGWELIKLYFLIGLPTETREDVGAIAGLVRRILDTARRASAGGKARLHLSVNLFVPKAQTPFQWMGQLPRKEAAERFRKLADDLPRSAGFRFGPRDEQDLDRSYLEAILARGDRRLFATIRRAWELGARFDSWGDQFQFVRWQQALEETGISGDEYALRERTADEVFPWSHLSLGVDSAYLRAEWERARESEPTPDCRKSGQCGGCGAWDPAECPRPKARPSSGPPAASKPAVESKPEREHMRIRFSYSKTGDLRFLGHLDLVNVFRRAARRAQLPLHYSRGFHPQPALAFGPPLPLGFEALNEWLDLGLDRWLDPREIAEKINRVFPAGIQVKESREVPLSTPALQERIQAGHYRMVFPNGIAHLSSLPERIDAFWKSEEVWGEQWSKQGTVKVNLRPSVPWIRRLEDGERGLEMIHLTGLPGGAKVPPLLDYFSRDFCDPWQVRITRIFSGCWRQDKLTAP